MATFYKTIATPQDILFTPLDEEKGLRVLCYFRALLTKYKSNFIKLYELKEESTEESYIAYLQSLDPQSKEIDFYRILRLGHLRHRATFDDIHKAYHQICLKHHPDKRLNKNSSGISDYFFLILRAYDTLSTNKKAFDSIDPSFDNNVPTKSSVKTPSQFYKNFGYFFANNSRWSNKVPVPLLGSCHTPRDEVMEFYEFWYNFDSWREFSFLDEEDKESGTFREERRWIEKKNKAARAKLRKDEMQRIRSAVDLAYSLDPRIKFFKEEDIKKKEDAKEARKNIHRLKQQEEEKLREEEAKQKAQEKERIEQEAAEIRERELKLKKEKEVMKRKLKKERNSFRTLCKENNYYSPPTKNTMQNMTHVEQLCDLLELTKLEELTDKLSKLNFEDASILFNLEVKSLIERNLETTTSKPILKNTSIKPNNNWSSGEISILIKAVNLYPAGTFERWEIIANYLNQHNNQGSSIRTAKEVLFKAKDLKTSDFASNCLKKEVNEKAFNNFQKTVKTVPVESGVTEREKTILKNGDKKENEDEEGSEGIVEWSGEEQKLLEQGLKLFPASDPARWKNIADYIPGKTKKDCIKRFKELAALVKAKKLGEKKEDISNGMKN